MKSQDVVAIGPTTVAILCHRMAVIRGVGQVWHTMCDKLIMSMIDIRGHTTWSVVTSLNALVTFYNARPVPLLEWERDRERGAVGDMALKNPFKLPISGGVVINAELSEFNTEEWKKIFFGDDDK